MVYNNQRFGNKLNKIEYKYVNMVTEFEGNDWNDFDFYLWFIVLGLADFISIVAMINRSTLAMRLGCKYNRVPDKKFAKIVSTKELESLNTLIEYLKKVLPNCENTLFNRVYGAIEKDVVNRDEPA